MLRTWFRIRIIPACSAAALLLLATSAHAYGFGVFFVFAYVFDSQLVTIAGDIDYDEDHFGAGLTFDTNVANDKLFNYRLNFGYEHVEGEYNGFDDDGDGFFIDNAFGFGVVRTNRIRFWIGPAVRMSFDWFNDSDVFDYGVGVGPEVGINLHTGTIASIALTGGYQILYVLSVPDGPGDDEDGYEQLAFIRLDVLFRSQSDGAMTD